MQLNRKARKGSLGAGLASLMIAPETVTRRVDIVGKTHTIEVDASIWDSLLDIAERESKEVDDLCAEVFTGPLAGMPLDASIPVFVLNYYRGLECV